MLSDVLSSIQKTQRVILFGISATFSPLEVMRVVGGLHRDVSLLEGISTQSSSEPS